MEYNKTPHESFKSIPSPAQSTITLDAMGKKENSYNPFEHRRVMHPTSTLGSFFNLLKSSLGTGLLAMPSAFQSAGLIPGCIGTLLVAVIATHCVHILVTTSRKVCEEIHVPSLSYTDTCEMTFKHGPKTLRKFSKPIRHFADFAMASVCLGGTSVYVIFIASSLKDIFDQYFPEENYVDLKIYCALLLPLLIFLTQFRYLKFLVPFSMFANLCLIVTFVITSYYIFYDIDDLIDQFPRAKLAVGYNEWPIFISTAIFAMEGINVVMPVENEMSKPQKFLGCCGVLNSTMGFVAALYGFVGFFGYIKYPNAKGSVTLNLPPCEPLAVTAKILVAIAVLFTYCLQMYAPMDIIWSRLQVRVSEKYHNLSQIMLRIVSVSLTVLLAVIFPDLKLLMGLVGAICFSTLGLLIPIVVETVYRWSRNLGPCNYVLLKNIILFTFYVLVLISGCYTALLEYNTKKPDSYNATETGSCKTA